MNKKEVIKSALERAYSFSQYIELIEKLHLEEKATSFQDNPDFYSYSALGLRRMVRIHKKHTLTAELAQIIETISEPQTWLIISESWCGDASQTLPILVKAAEHNHLITCKIALRDSEPNLMEFYLTNGGKSIPKLAILDKDLNELGVWGPRPEPAQKLVLENKAKPEPLPYSEFNVLIQKWYNSDKGLTTETELVSTLKNA